MRLLTAALLATLFFNTPVWAADEPASKASVQELLNVMNAKQLIEDVKVNSGAEFKQMMHQILEQKQCSVEQQKILDDAIQQMNSILDEELSWPIFETYIYDIYTASFTQAEMDGMLTFYKSDIGQSVLKKMPVVMQHTMRLMQERFKIMLPKIKQIEQQMAEKLKKSKSKQRK